MIVRDITFTGGTGGQPAGWNASCGGAMVLENSSSYHATLENLVFDGNTAPHGGALCIDGAASAVATVTISSCTFINNTAGFRGGAIFANGLFHIVDSDISDNSAKDGGGIYMSYGCFGVDSCTITTTSVKRNTASSSGGGVWIGTNFTDGDLTLTVVDSDFGFGVEEENSPDDVRTNDASYGFYGNGVSFTCDGICTAP